MRSPSRSPIHDSNESSYRYLIWYSLPIIAATLVEPMAEIVDTAFIGRMGSHELAALSACSMIFAVSVWIFNFLIQVGTVEIAGFYGEKNQKSLAETIRFSLITGTLLGIFLTVSLATFSDFFLLRVMKLSSETYPLAEVYLTTRLWGFSFVFINIAITGILRGLQLIKTSMALIVFQSLFNIILTYILIYKFQMGIQGAAIGTVMAHGLTAGLGIYFVIHRSQVNLAEDLFHVNWSRLRDFLSKSSHQFLRTLALSGSHFVAVSLANREGHLTAAAFQITLQLWLLNAYVLDGFAGTASGLGSKVLGQGKQNTWALITKRCSLLALISGGVFIALYTCYPQITGLFSNDQIVTELVASIWWIIIIAQIPNAIAFIFDGIIFGKGWFRLARNCMWQGLIGIYTPLLIWLWYSDHPALTAIWTAGLGLSLFRCARLFPKIYREWYTKH
ncbi:MAG: MATE family efflux transporter [Pseudobacteriovorax sp.]|nr:MATE family efflux transporter [Pseudobacteriovorax sp.]